MTLPSRAGAALLILASALGACTPENPSARLSLEQSMATPHLVALAGSGGGVGRVAAALPAEVGTPTAPHVQASAGGVLQETPIVGGGGQADA